MSRINVAMITLDESGAWGVRYVSHATGEPTMQEIVGAPTAKLADLVPPLEKHKARYVEDIKGAKDGKD